MLSKTFAIVQKMVADDPLTEHQIKVLSGDVRQELVTKKEAAQILGISVRQLLRLPIRRIFLGNRSTRIRLGDLYDFIAQRSEI